MPPVSEIKDAIVYAVLPAAVTAFVVFIGVAKLNWKPSAVIAGALALALGFIAGNAFRGAVEYRLDFEQPLTPMALGQAVLDTFVPPQDEDAPIPPPARYWLPWTTGLALLVGLLTFRLKPSLRWLIRAALAGFAASLAVPIEIRAGMLWSVPVLSAVILGEWFVLDQLASVEEERLRLLPPLAGVMVFGGASIVLLHAHSARFVDIATIMAASLAAIVCAAWLLRCDPSGVVPGIAVALPSLMLVGQQDTFSAVPTASFVLIGLAPLLLAPCLTGGIRRFRPTIVWSIGIALLAAPVAVAVALAAANESLSFE